MTHVYTRERHQNKNTRFWATYGTLTRICQGNAFFCCLIIGSPKIDVESLILMIEPILVSILFNLTRATLLSYVIKSTVMLI